MAACGQLEALYTLASAYPHSKALLPRQGPDVSPSGTPPRSTLGRAPPYTARCTARCNSSELVSPASCNLFVAGNHAPGTRGGAPPPGSRGAIDAGRG